MAGMVEIFRTSSRALFREQEVIELDGELQKLLGVRHEHFSVAAEPDIARRPLEKRDAQLVFQRHDMARERRLRHEQQLRRLQIVLRPRKDEKFAHQPDIHLLASLPAKYYSKFAQKMQDESASAFLLFPNFMQKLDKRRGKMNCQTAAARLKWEHRKICFPPF